jgi:3',5'-cyclic-AMP phosphodiesterase
MEKPLQRIVQISDMHLFAEIDRELLGVRTQQSFQAVLDLMQQKEQSIDLILVSGDLSQDCSATAYIRLAEALSVFGVPIYYAPGNHDNIHTMNLVYPHQHMLNEKHIVLQNWHIILLNSQKPGRVEGYLDKSQLDFLQQALLAYPDHRAIILLHHQPLSIGSGWLDHIGLTNAQTFWQLLAGYPNVHTVLFGHVHQQDEQIFQGVHCYSAPSTCVQFKRYENHFALEKLPPGYRWIQLYANDQLETGICRTEDYIGTFHENAKGY